jgi:hypothetical protein
MSTFNHQGNWYTGPMDYELKLTWM